MTSRERVNRRPKLVTGTPQDELDSLHALAKVFAMRWFSISLFLVLALSDAFSAENESALPDREEGYEHVERFIKILEEVRTHHPEAEKLSYERLVNHALDGMFDSLDTFSSFYHPETVQHLDFEKTKIEEQFAVTSLGVVLASRDKTVYVASIRDHSPAARAGLRRDDILVRKEDLDLAALDLPQAHRALQGQPGESIALTVYRKSARREVTVELLHAVIKQDALPEARLLTEHNAPQVGYTRLTQFTATAANELEVALDELEDQGLTALILDLRGNPGGLLTVAVDLLSLFLPPNTQVVTTQGRSPKAQTPPLTTAAKQRVKRDYPLVILLDRHSASASELVAGALQDLARATVVGETSFGKGSVQSVDGRPGGTAVRLTFATYHTPSGKTPHEIGVTPDILVPLTEEDEANFERFKARATATPETQAALQQWTDPVLHAALLHLKSQ